MTPVIGTPLLDDPDGPAQAATTGTTTGTLVAAPPVVEPAPAPARKRRAYQVWERDADDAGEHWFIVAESVDATSRPVAIEQTTGGRPGTFATVLVGEWVEETIDDPQGVLVDAVTAAVDGLVGVGSTDELRDAVRKALAGATASHERGASA